MFINGQKVVCIDGKFDAVVMALYTALPVENFVYVVRGMAVGVSVGLGVPRVEGELAVYLVSLQSPCSEKAPFRERGFRAERFRPLVELTEEEIRQLTQPETVTQL